MSRNTKCHAKHAKLHWDLLPHHGEGKALPFRWKQIWTNEVLILRNPRVSESKDTLFFSMLIQSETILCPYMSRFQRELWLEMSSYQPLIYFSIIFSCRFSVLNIVFSYLSWDLDSQHTRMLHGAGIFTYKTGW
jgi:hypothetical protein